MKEASVHVHSSTDRRCSTLGSWDAGHGPTISGARKARYDSATHNEKVKSLRNQLSTSILTFSKPSSSLSRGALHFEYIFLRVDVKLYYALCGFSLAMAPKEIHICIVLFLQDGYVLYLYRTGMAAG